MFHLVRYSDDCVFGTSHQNNRLNETLLMLHWVEGILISLFNIHISEGSCRHGLEADLEEMQFLGSSYKIPRVMNMHYILSKKKKTCITY